MGLGLGDDRGYLSENRGERIQVEGAEVWIAAVARDGDQRLKAILVGLESEHDLERARDIDP
ncbi:MAG: hypothetical protein JRN08_07970 [Nitrososphaerota archaeon]|nr:hypothetical protein [Nitrososphaerota archaeon]